MRYRSRTIRTPPEYMSASNMFRNGYTLPEIEAHVRKCVVMAAIRAESGHKGRAAKRLGVHRNTVTRLLGE